MLIHYYKNILYIISNNNLLHDECPRDHHNIPAAVQ